MDPDLVQKIYKDVVQAVSKPSVRDRLITSGNEPILSEPAAFKKFLETEVERWGKVINDNHLKLN
jgi:tripartite-type tricarboxylate transporter receptor subunit TctC